MAPLPVQNFAIFQSLTFLAIIVVSASSRIVPTFWDNRSHELALTGQNRKSGPTFVLHGKRRRNRSISFLSIHESQSLMERLRGGSSSDERIDDEEDEDEEDDDDDVEEKSENDDTVVENKGPDGEEQTNDKKKIAEEATKSIELTVRTSLGNELLDQSINVDVSSHRDVAFVKKKLSKELPGRPPIPTMQLLHDGRMVADSVLLSELIDDEEDDDDEEEDEDDVGDDEGASRLTLHLDMIPPIDSKSASYIEQRLDELTTSELLEAYAVNEAAAYQNTVLLLQPDDPKPSDDDNDEEDEGLISSDTTRRPVMASEQVRTHASLIRKDLEASLQKSKRAQILLAETEAPNGKNPALLQQVQVRGDRRRIASAAMGGSNFSRILQRNLNIDWGNSIWNFCLFLFFGYFGGRTPLSRMVLFLGAPLVFLLQYRPVKIWLKELFYMVMDHPPDFVLSLLPAPQKAILSLDLVEAYSVVYGDFVENPAAAARVFDREEELDVELDEVDEEVYDDDEDEDEEDED